MGSAGQEVNKIPFIKRARMRCIPVKLASEGRALTLRLFASLSSSTLSCLFLWCWFLIEGLDVHGTPALMQRGQLDVPLRRQLSF